MKQLCLLMCLLAAMAGCATKLPNLNIEEMAANGLAAEKDQSAQDVIALAGEDISKASKEELDYYAPRHLAMAEEHLKKAQNLMVSGGDEATALTEAAFARKVVEKGLMVKQTVLRQLNDIFDMKQRLKAMKAEVYFRDEFDDQMAHIRKLINYIEKGDQAAVDKKKADYLTEMLALEVDVVKKKTLTEAIETLKKARDQDAKKLAPKTYKTAEDTLAQSTVFIESFPRDEKGVAKAGLDALRACQHALYVTREVIAIKDMDKDDFEDLILDFENKLNRITQSLGEEDVRYMSLHDQSVALSGKAEELKRNASSASLAVKPVSAPAEEMSATDVPANQPDQAVTVTGEPSPDDVAAVVEPASEESVETQSTTDPEKIGEDTAFEELEAETSEATQEETAAISSEENPSTAKDDSAAPAPEASSTTKADKAEAPPEENSWDGSAETFNMDDLYLSDEERVLKQTKTQ